MRKLISGLAVMAVAAAGTAVWLSANQPATAQSFGSPAMMVAAANAGANATDMWAIDARTNQVIYCRGQGGAPTCRTTLVPGAAQPIDKLPR